MTRARRIPGGRKLLAAASLLFACTNTPAQQPRDAGADAASDAAEPDIAADVASPTDEGNPIDLADEGGDVRDMGGGAAAVIYADGDDFEVVDAFGPRVGGMFRGTLTFEPGTARERTLTSRGERDIFLAEVGVNGELVRVYHWGGPSDDGLWRRSTAQDQPLGWFTDEMTLDDGTTTSSVQHTGLSTFVIRVDRPEERTLSDWPIDGIGPSMLRVVDVSYGRTLYAGEFTGSITINAPDGAPVELQSRGGTDIFAALWPGDVVQIGGPGDERWGDAAAWLGSNEVGGYIVVGSFAGDIEVSDGMGVRSFSSQSAAGLHDGFIYRHARLDPGGEFLAQGVGGDTHLATIGLRLAPILAFDPIVAGTFSADAPTAFGTSLETTLQSTGGTDIVWLELPARDALRVVGVHHAGTEGDDAAVGGLPDVSQTDGGAPLMGLLGGTTGTVDGQPVDFGAAPVGIHWDGTELHTLEGGKLLLLDIQDTQTLIAGEIEGAARLRWGADVVELTAGRRRLFLHARPTAP